MPILKGIGLYQSRTAAECNFGLAGQLCTATTSMLDVRELGENYWRGHPFTVSLCALIISGTNVDLCTLLVHTQLRLYSSLDQVSAA